MTNKPNKRTLLIIVVLLILAIGVLGWTNRHKIAVQLAPKKQAATTRSDAAIAACQRQSGQRARAGLDHRRP